MPGTKQGRLSDVSDAAEQTVVLAAGGTGGHLFPAFALAEELGRRGLGVELMTDMRGDRYGTGFPARAVHKIPSATLGGKSPVKLARTAMMLGRGIVNARGVLKRVRPGAVVGFGGYPSFPPLMAAGMLKIPTVLHEQNAVMGRANRMLAKRADRIALSFADTKFVDGELAAKAVLTGNPVRQQVIDHAGVPYPPLDERSAVRLLIFGGSQGARVFSDVMPEAIRMLPQQLKARLHVTHQAREEDMDRVQQAYADMRVAAEVAPFFKGLPEIMAASHLVVARSGASSVAELAVLGRPSILVPLPHALDSDQLLNAQELQNAGGAWCVQQPQFQPEAVANQLCELCDAPETLQSAAANASRVGHADAVAKLADSVLSLMLR